MRRHPAAATTASDLPPFLAFLAWTAVTSRRPSHRAITACISCIRALGGLLAPVGSCAGQHYNYSWKSVARTQKKRTTLESNPAQPLNTHNHSNQQQLWCRHAHRRGVPL